MHGVLRLSWLVIGSGSVLVRPALVAVVCCSLLLELLGTLAVLLGFGGFLGGGLLWVLQGTGKGLSQQKCNASLDVGAPSELVCYESHPLRSCSHDSQRRQPLG
jgi:hypothetical protein